MDSALSRSPWDANFTDVDLHVVEPSGEEVACNHTSSAAGAQITSDNTSGFGPEIYTIRKAPAGEYIVHLSYYSADNTAANNDIAAQVTVHRKDSKGRITRTVHPLLLQNNGEKSEVVRIRF